MRRRSLCWAAIVVTGCDKGASSGSAPTGSGPVIARPIDAAACDLGGTYRIRFRANGHDGWWLRLRITADHAEQIAKHALHILPAGPLAFVRDPTECKGTISATTESAGDVRLELVLDPATNAVTGQLSRSRGGGKTYREADTTPISGLRDVGAIAGAACINPGVYELAIGKTNWKQKDSPGDCHGSKRRSRDCLNACVHYAHAARATVRVEPFGSELVIDEVSGDDHHQGFARGMVVRKNECEYDVELKVQDFSFSATLVFAGDSIKGSARTTRFQVFEDGDAGENLWSCNATNAPIAGKRIAD